MTELAQPGPRFREIARGKLGDAHTQAALDTATNRLRTNRVAAWEGLPDVEAMREQAHRIKMSVIDDLDGHVARFTEAFEARGGKVFFARTGAEASEYVARVCRDAGAKLAAKSKSMATEEIGLKQPVEYTDEERRRIATHEAGHATIAWLVGKDRKLEVLSIIKRKDALGLLAHSDSEERFTHTRTEIVARIQIAFGGMTAEEIFFGESGTGPGGDLAHATRIAAQMVGSFGMAGSLVSFEAVEAGPISQGIVGKVLANEDARASVERLLDQAKAQVHTLLDSNRHLVIALRDELLDRDELVGDEIVDVLVEADKRKRLDAPAE